MWEIVKLNNVKNKGKNIWVYESGDKVFAGVEPENDVNGNRYGLEKKEIILEKYAYYKHIGPYSLIKQSGQNMTSQLVSQGFEVVLPYIEMYATGQAMKLNRKQSLSCV
jgi:hypothetical protein